MQTENKIFEEFGFFKEYWIRTKFIGYCLCEKDRELTGYHSRQDEVTTSEILLTNKKKIKSGTAVTTSIYPLCGKSFK